MTPRLPTAPVRAAPAAAALLLAGCLGDFLGERDMLPEQVKDLAKSDLDFALDAHLAETRESLARLMRLLYRLNPEQLARRPDAAVEERVALLLPTRKYAEMQFGELGGKRDNDALLLAFEPAFPGDRVFALMVGLASQMRVAYGDQDEFFAPDRLDAANLRNFAANLEIVRRILPERAGVDGAPLLRYRSEAAGNGAEPADARPVLDQAAGHQRVLARVIDGWQARAERRAVQTMGAVILLPIP